MPYPLRVRLTISDRVRRGRAAGRDGSPAGARLRLRGRCRFSGTGRRRRPSRPSSAARSSTATAARRPPDAVVLIWRARASPRSARAARVAIPAGARQIDARGQWILPGLDRHQRPPVAVRRPERPVRDARPLSAAAGRHRPRGRADRSELRHHDRARQLRRADAAGAGPRRDRRAATKVGARILAAGNILGWSGPYSFSFSRVMGQLTLFQEQMNDFIAQGGGEELMAMTPGRAPARDRRLSRQGTGFHEVRRHEPFLGADLHRLLRRSAAGDRRGGAPARTRPPKRMRRASKACGSSIAAGIDGIQHPELLDGREMPDDLVTAIRDRGLYCSMLASTITGPAWKRHLKTKDEVEKKRAEAEKEGRAPRAREDDGGTAQGSRRGRRRISRCGGRTRRS